MKNYVSQHGSLIMLDKLDLHEIRTESRRNVRLSFEPRESAQTTANPSRSGSRSQWQFRSIISQRDEHGNKIVESKKSIRLRTSCILNPRKGVFGRRASTGYTTPKLVEPRGIKTDMQKRRVMSPSHFRSPFNKLHIDLLDILNYPEEDATSVFPSTKRATDALKALDKIDEIDLFEPHIKVVTKSLRTAVFCKKGDFSRFFGFHYLDPAGIYTSYKSS